jgi:transglutaminase-like putative cysteine protease
MRDTSVIYSTEESPLAENTFAAGRGSPSSTVYAILISEYNIRNTPLTASEFPGTASYGSAALAAEMIPNTLGEFDVELILDGQSNPTRVTVVDTTPPIAEPAQVQWYLGHPLAPEKLVSNAFDFTQITYSFKQEPDWNSQATQNVIVVLTDAAGNVSEYTSSLTLSPDTEAPVLYGVTDHHVYIGQAVAYFADVFAQDNCDSEVDVQVDNSQVDMNAAGTYQVTYTATDSSGNKTQASCSFTFVEETVTDEQLHGAAQQVLSEITTADMSIGDKAYAIFKYVNTHIKYNGISNKNDYKYEAYRGITEGRGDCFTFYATARCLLDEIGAQTMCVERWGSKTKTTHHYWVLANLGTGWYHFDAINVGPRNFDCFMKTDKELLGRGPNWWSFNKALYPRTPDESFVR